MSTILSSIWLFVFIITALSVHRTFSSIEKNRGCDMDEFDRCGLTVQIFGNPNAFIPLDLEMLEERCHIDKEANNCWRKNLKACLKEPLTRQVLSLILQSVESMVRQRCVDGEYQKELLKSLKCIYNIREVLHVCMHGLMRDMYRSSLGAPDQQIPLSCCLYNTYTNCAIGEIKEKCEEEDVEFVLEFLDGYAGDTLGLMCGGYMPGSPKCKDLVLPELPEGNVTLPRSLVPIIIDILSGLTRSKK